MELSKDQYRSVGYVARLRYERVKFTRLMSQMDRASGSIVRTDTNPDVFVPLPPHISFWSDFAALVGDINSNLVCSNHGTQFPGQKQVQGKK